MNVKEVAFYLKVVRMVGGIETLPTCLVINDRITKAKTGMKGRRMIQSELI
jgi:hypothetical protein